MQSDDPIQREEVGLETDAALQKLAAAIRRRSPAIGPELDRRIMAAVRHSLRWQLRAALRWWLRPRPIPISPLGGLLAAGAMALLTLVVVRHAWIPAPSVPPSGVQGALVPATASTTDEVRVVRFVLAAPNASQVNLVGDFNGWDTAATPLRPVGAAGVWSVEVPLTPGRHEYAFLIDGREWRPDPATPRAAADDYGSPNSVIIVGAHST
jgi:hypothetical protein